MRNEITSTLIGDSQLFVSRAAFFQAFTPSSQSFNLSSAQFEFLRSKGFKQAFCVKVSDIVAKKQFTFTNNQDLLSFVNRNLQFINQI